jgi:uncharacterized protein
MPKNDRLLHNIIHSLLGLVLISLLAACNLPDAPKTSTWDANDYFTGKAVELADAAMQGDAQEIKRLMKEEGVNPDSIFGEGAMPLVAWPIITESPEGLKAMLENGANPNARMIDKSRDRGQNRNNAMVMAAGLKDPQYLQLLLEHGGDPNTHNSNNESLLMTAWLQQRQWPNIQLLVLNGANINMPGYSSDRSDSPDTVISWYASYSNFDKVYWLLEHGADPTLKHYGKFHPPEGTMYVAEQIFWAPSYPEQLPWQRKCQQWLLKKGIKRAEKMPEGIRSERKAKGYPTDEKDVPLL